MHRISRLVVTHTFVLISLALSCPASAQAPAGKSPDAKPALPVKAATVRTGTISTDVSAVGTLLANESVMIRPEITGRIVAIHFDEGQAVPKGARLLTLDQSEYKAILAQTDADAKLATRRYERSQELRKQNFISQEAVDEARTNLERSAARRQETEVKLAKSDIRAPFSGIVGLRQVSPGAYVKEGADIVRLEDIDSIKLDFRIPEVYLGKLRKDQDVTVRVDAYPNQEFRGRIYALEPGVDEKSRTVLARARIVNKDRKLRPGMFARVALSLGSRETAIMVPDQAIVPRGDSMYVFRVIDGKAVLTPVQTGARAPGEVEVVKGLTARDVIVVDGQLKLQDGMAVRIMADDPPVSAASPKGAG
jgi:membrane fusion protein (multidrug efflux system)